MQEIKKRIRAEDKRLAIEGVVQNTPLQPQPQAKASPKKQEKQQQIISPDQFDEITGGWEYWRWTQEPHVYTLTGFAFKHPKTGEWMLNKVTPPMFDRPVIECDIIDIDGQVCVAPNGKPHPKKVSILHKQHVEQMQPLIEEAIADGSLIVVATISAYKEGEAKTDRWVYTTVNMKHQKKVEGD